jgi:hypothetical protein
LLLFLGAVYLIRDHGKKIDPFRETATIQAATLQGQTNKQKFVIIDGLSLSQGEDGQLDWKLTSERTVSSDPGGLITVSNPFLTLFTKNPGGANAENDPVTVQGLRGEIDRATNNMRFMDDVIVVNYENHITTSRLDFVAAEKIIYCPGQTYFSNPTMQGVSGNASLAFDSNILDASGGVLVDAVLAPAGEKNNPNENP